MRKTTYCAAVATVVTLFAAGCAPVEQATHPDDPYSKANEQSIVFTSNAGDTTDAFRGMLQVPENHSVDGSRTLTLHYVRFPSTAEDPGPPIVYLAGGPGGSGIATAKWRRYPLFMAMRAFGDVIALDQRGTGDSNDQPPCESPYTEDPTARLSDADYIALERKALSWCIADWKSQGIDLAGYNTEQSVADLEALRRHLGADKLTLWGTSYGSHLALAALKTMDDRIERVVLSSVEGLDQTIKRPARTDAYLHRLEAALADHPSTAGMYPDVLGMMRRVHEELDESPLLVDVQQRTGGTLPVLVQSRTLRLYAAGMIRDARTASYILAAYKGLDEGNQQPLIQLLQFVYRAPEPISFRHMSVMMDLASGITGAKRHLIETEAETAALGTFLNFTLHFFDVAPEYDLGDAFRAKPVSNVPTLVLSGTLDGRTYVDGQREATDGLTNRQIVTVINAGHNLFMASPEVTTTIEAFMRGESVDGKVLEVPLRLE